MPKSRRNRSMKNRTSRYRASCDGPGMHESTMKGLYEWQKYMFEELGWMVLVKSKGHNYKVEAYKKSLGHLQKSIKQTIDEYVDHDRKRDLTVLHHNVCVLQEFVSKHL